VIPKVQFKLHPGTIRHPDGFMSTTDWDTDSLDYYRAALRHIRIELQRDLKERLSRKWKPGHGKRRILPGEGDRV